jgi:hypothetical protein
VTANRQNLIRHWDAGYRSGIPVTWYYQSSPLGCSSGVRSARRGTVLLCISTELEWWYRGKGKRVFMREIRLTLGLGSYREATCEDNESAFQLSDDGAWRISMSTNRYTAKQRPNRDSQSRGTSRSTNTRAMLLRLLVLPRVLYQE